MFLYKGQTFLLVRDLNLCPVELVNVIGSKLWWNVTDIESWDFKIQKILPKLFLSSFWAITFHSFSLEAITYRIFFKFGQKHFKFIKSHTSFIRFQLLLFTVIVKQTEIKQNRICMLFEELNEYNSWFPVLRKWITIRSLNLCDECNRVLSAIVYI